jgi:hypothetical protein
MHNIDDSGMKRPRYFKFLHGSTTHIESVVDT